MTRDRDGDGKDDAPGDWPDAAARRRASAFLDLWERHVSERARRGPAGEEAATGAGGAGRAETP